MIRCVAVDDEPLALDIIEAYVSQIKGATLVAKFTDPVETFTYVQQHPVDVLFLDLNMPMLNGMELLRNLKQRPAVIITTAYRDFAVESFELDVLDYLVKPISFPRFLKAVNKILTPALVPDSIVNVNEKKKEAENPLWLKVNKKMVSVAPSDIHYLQSLKDYVRVVTTDQKMVIYHTLQSMLDKLPTSDFIRIHKSYIVQVSKIKSIEGNSMKVREETLPIGRNYRRHLMKALEVK